VEWECIYASLRVLEKNPPKQGLKLKQRIFYIFNLFLVLEKNPPKQGLKQNMLKKI